VPWTGTSRSAARTAARCAGETSTGVRRTTVDRGPAAATRCTSGSAPVARPAYARATCTGVTRSRPCPMAEATYSYQPVPVWNEKLPFAPVVSTPVSCPNPNERIAP